METGFEYLCDLDDVKLFKKSAQQETLMWLMVSAVGSLEFELRKDSDVSRIFPFFLS
jgi:hypothetical protein